MYFELNLSVVCPREVRMNAVWSGASELLVALELEKKHLITHLLCSSLYVMCSMLECFDL